MSKGHRLKFFFALIIQNISILPFFSQTQNENQGFDDFGDQFSKSIYSIKELFLQQSDGGMDLVDLFILIASIVVSLFFISSLTQLIIYLVTKKRRKLVEIRFNTVKKTVLKVKQDFVTEEQISDAIDKGLMISKNVDKHTGRKNTLVIPIFVHRIATQLNVGEKKAALYFCASLFYDSGFLETPGELFFGEILTRKEKNEFKKHVLRIPDIIADLPPDLYQECFNACSFHHENYNGTGYPEGLAGDSIPTVARILRVVESYLSLISKGTYHRGLSKKRALKDLKLRQGLYDSKIIEILETLV